MMMTIYLVEQHYSAPNFGRPVEVLRAFDKLDTAQDFCKGRANVQCWRGHNSHGQSWESLDGDGIYSIVEIELNTRPATISPNVRLYASLEGITEVADGRRVAHHALVELLLQPQQWKARAAFSVPVTGFVAYGLRMQQVYIEPAEAELRLARMIVDSVPADIWDACVAALRADCEKSVDTVLDVLRTWGERLMQLSDNKPLEPGGLAGLESEEE